MTARKPAEITNCQVLEQVLVVDDDRGICECVEMLLARAGYACVVTHLGRDGLAALDSREFDLVITDLRLPDASGLDIVARAKAAHSETQVILMTSFSSVESAIEALRRGANDYVIKPFDNDDFLFSVERALGERRTRMENAALKRSLRNAFPQNTIIGESEAAKRLRAMIQRVAATEANVLIQGESGTGKELVAQAIHFGGKRAHRPFVAVNCGAMPADLIESELFGHEKGAFTGAEAAKPGLIEEAQGGTVFLDEVGELPLATQAKLLRVLEQRELQRVGGLKPRPIDVRFVAATNRDLEAEVAAGRFRQDLLYRLNGASLRVPPLRERTTEIAPLARLFAARAAASVGLTVQPELTAEALTRLEAYSWPGNIRELRNAIERAVLLGGEVIAPEHLPLDKLSAVWTAAPARSTSSMRDRIMEALEATAHNQTRAAERLGVSRQTLSTWLDRYDIPRPRRRGP